MFQKKRAIIRAALLLLILLGVGFRFYNLDKKVFWLDEVGSLQRISGYTFAEIGAESQNRRYWSPPELTKYYQVHPERGVRDTWRTLATDDPQHPPFFYVLLRLWAGVFGDSVTALRLLPALLSLLVFPALWWLCRELFFDDPHRKRITWVALSLMALSPFHVLYAQETRQYSLFAVLILTSTALLLRALRQSDWKVWALYALCLTAAFYTHVLALFLWLAHIGYIALDHWRSKSKANPLPVFGAATLAAALLFLPWAIEIWQGREAASGNVAWSMRSHGSWFLFKRWMFMFSSLYFDPNNTELWNDGTGLYPLAALMVRMSRSLLCILAVFALIQVWRRAPRRAADFICCLALTPFVTLALADLFSGGYRSGVGRFMIPTLLGVHLAVAWLMAVRLRAPATRRRWMGLLGVILACQLLSCLLISRAETWWVKSVSNHTPQVARLINAQTRPLLITEIGTDTFVLNRMLKPHVGLYLLTDKEEKVLSLWWVLQHPAVTARRHDAIFLYDASDKCLASLEKQKVVLLKVEERLWRLQKP